MISGRNYFALLNPVANTPIVATGTPAKINVSDNFNPFNSELKAEITLVPAVGASGFLTVTFVGPYAIGDDIRLTITSNLTSRQAWRKSYTHTVQAGLTTVTDIANAFTAMILTDVNNSLNSPYSAVSNIAGVMTVTQFDDDKQGLVSYTFTDSAAGTITSVLTPTVISEGQPSDLLDRGITADEIANYGAMPLGGWTTLRITLHSEAAIPFVDSQGATAKEIYWYGTAGDAAALALLIP
jgi:hypothetical protein